ncbi:hypothetical protein AX766_01015 [Flavobacterium covae]|uniref:HmuY protein n=1 Tax=Flavobacterium columnare TaxID=996 RepID=A0AA94F231_9FLAO|nr:MULTISPECIES: HmuY family protein [Flavobacterium]AND63103.1 hypothetical protein AX766_01015 [Flavobacterium covae]MCH4828677.1 hypothetical protein [Flavobacterium columnare]MCH4831930.1 hypothetical protein [Flavobacterium columnare]OWP86313.1 hypothetical protein BWK60_09495 [Flavobacterium covae]QYS90494.1 hypothetical protein JJC04_10390 [Flavobacterium covae]
MKKGLLLLYLTTFFISCSKETIDEKTKTVISKEEILKPEIGGPNQPNQVFLDLSKETSKVVNRATWDLGFYSGDGFRVILNSSIFMAVKKTDQTDITLVQNSDKNVVSLGGFNLAKNGYCDDATGVLNGKGKGEGTAIAEISAVDNENKVYLLNLGFEVSTNTPAIGSVSTEGKARGWKKIRILRANNGGYKIQYADLLDKDFKEKIIDKDRSYNFTFFSLFKDEVVVVEPKKESWDLCFTTFTNYILSGDDIVTYGFADFVISNMKGGAQVYEVNTSEYTYEKFKKENVIESNLIPSKKDQRIIGSNWRVGGSQFGGLPSIKTDRFYVLKDIESNYYKIKFLTMTNDKGERGNTKIQYSLL